MIKNQSRCRGAARKSRRVLGGRVATRHPHIPITSGGRGLICIASIGRAPGGHASTCSRGSCAGPAVCATPAPVWNSTFLGELSSKIILDNFLRNSFAGAVWPGHKNPQDQAERSGDPERERGEPRAAAAERPKLPPTPKAPLPPPGPTWGDFIGTQVAQSHRPIHRSPPCHVAPMSFTSGCRCSCSQAEPAMSDPIGHGTPPLGAAHAPKPPRPRAPCC